MEEQLYIELNELNELTFRIKNNSKRFPYVDHEIILQCLRTLNNTLGECFYCLKSTHL